MVTQTHERLPSLTVGEKLRLVTEILGTYVAVRWQMRRSDIREMVEHLRAVPTGAVHHDYLLVRRLGRAVARTLSFLPTDNRCLARSLVLDTMLARRRLQSVLIVAARTEPDFAAHAWVEHDGLPVLPPGSPSYQRLIEL
jgi:Transglutaminase-like superfamily